MMKVDLKYYDSLEILPLYNWDKFLTTNNNNWFIVGFDNRQTVISNPQLSELSNKLEDEYFTLLDDPSTSKRLKTWAKIDNLQTRYNIVFALVERFWAGFSDYQQHTRIQFIEVLAKYGYKIGLMNSIEQDAEDLILISNQLQGIRTQIDILLKQVKTDSKKEVQSLQKQLILIAISLQLNYRLNPKELTVAEWIEYTKILKERSKNN